MLKNRERYFKKIKKDSNKIKIYQYNITGDISHLFNEITKEDYYEPIEIKSAFVIYNMKVEEIVMIIYH